MKPCRTPGSAGEVCSTRGVSTHIGHTSIAYGESCLNESSHAVRAHRSTGAETSGTERASIRTLPEYLASMSIPEPNTGCRLWLGSTWDGYGMLSHRGVRDSAHRAAWKAARGPIPPGLLVCHKCDTPPCINPDHLFLGTHVDNAADMVAKGRRRGGGPSPGARNGMYRRPESNGRVKLTAAQVAEIRALAGSVTHRELAARFGVDRSRVSQIVRGKGWQTAVAR